MKPIKLASSGGTNVNRASSKDGFVFQLLMTVEMLIQEKSPVSVTIYLYGSGGPLSATHT
jgi:hypothetical protein